MKEKREGGKFCKFNCQTRTSGRGEKQPASHLAHISSDNPACQPVEYAFRPIQLCQIRMHKHKYKHRHKAQTRCDVLWVAW